MTKDCFFNHELPMSEIVSHAQILKRRYIVNSVGVNPSFPTITMWILTLAASIETETQMQTLNRRSFVPRSSNADRRKQRASERDQSDRRENLNLKTRRGSDRAWIRREELWFCPWRRRRECDRFREQWIDSETVRRRTLFRLGPYYLDCDIYLFSKQSIFFFLFLFLTLFIFLSNLNHALLNRFKTAYLYLLLLFLFHLN